MADSTMRHAAVVVGCRARRLAPLIELILRIVMHENFRDT